MFDRWASILLDTDSDPCRGPSGVLQFWNVDQLLISFEVGEFLKAAFFDNKKRRKARELETKKSKDGYFVLLVQQQKCANLGFYFIFQSPFHIALCVCLAMHARHWAILTKRERIRGPATS